MNPDESMYLCTTCFNASPTRADCHGRPMRRFDTGHPGDELRKPIADQTGRLESRAPRWFWQSMRQLHIPAKPSSR
jgi:hypothetical protein